MKRLVLAALVAAAVLAGCQDTRPILEPPEPTTTTIPLAQDRNRVKVTGTEYAFQLEGGLTEGNAYIEFANAGAEEHIVVGARMKAATTLPQVVAALKTPTTADENALFEAFHEMPELFASAGEHVAVAVATLKAGKYALICFVPAADGQLHAAKGMITELDVAAAKEKFRAPGADHTVTIRNGGIEAPTQLKAGPVKLEVKSVGDEHNFALVRANPGKTTDDVIAYLDTKFGSGKAPRGPPPGAAIAVGGLFVGQDVLVYLDLKPGSHRIYCDEIDPAQGGAAPVKHSDRGEKLEVAVI